MLKKNKEDDYIEIGTKKINLSKLYNDKKLKILYPDDNIVQGLKMQDITDQMINMIDDILEKKPFDEDNFDLLNNNEKLLYKMIVKKCNIAGLLNIRLDRLNTNELQKIKDDFNVCMGELDAGNDSPKLIKQAKELINEMLDKKMISNNQALNYLRNL